MKRAAILTMMAAALAWFAAAPADAQRTTSQVRGKIAGPDGKPLADVDVEIQYVGEGPKRVYHQKTDKNGGFVRVGLQPGSYKIYFTKEGYQKYGIDTWLSLGGLSEMCSNRPRPNEPCEDIKLKKAEVTLAIGASRAEGGQAGGTGQPGAPGSGMAKTTAEEAAKLGAAFTQAVEAIKTAQWDAAETALKEVLAKIPDQPVVLFNLGHVYRQRKDYASAETEFKRVTELEPTKLDAFVALAALYETEGKGAEAVEFLLKNAAAFEQDAKFQMALGATAMNQGREPEAEAAFSKAATLDSSPANIEVQYYLATLALNRNEVADAIAHLETYVAAAPADSPNVETAKRLLNALPAPKKK